jgi:Mg2+/Co2+ transporter CorB
MQYGVLAILLMISGLFSIAETSLMSLNRYRLRKLVDEGHRGARLAAKLLNKTDKLLGVILLGNNFANACSVTLVAVISVELYGEDKSALMVGTILISVATLIFSEMLPRVFAARFPERIAFASSYVLTPLLKLLYPMVWLINAVVNFIARLFGIKVNFTENGHALSMDELRHIVLDAGSYIPKKHRAILLNLFDFDEPIEEIIKQLSSSQHTRLPVRQGAKEEIVGILHIRKVMNHLRDGELDLEVLQEIISDPYFIPSGTPLYMQMQQFQENKQRIALVVDEYGELKGLVTLEDILEEIIGDFTTQSPSLSGAYHQDEDGSWLVDGISPLRDLNKKLALSLPLDGPRTLNGLVLEHFEDIPEPGTSFKIAGHTLEIVQTQDKVVKSVRIFP